MNILESIIRPFGYTGMPKLKEIPSELLDIILGGFLKDFDQIEAKFDGLSKSKMKTINFASLANYLERRARYRGATSANVKTLVQPLTKGDPDGTWQVQFSLYFRMPDRAKTYYGYNELYFI